MPRIRRGPHEISYIYEKGDDMAICRKYWWRNLLLIHNFFDADSMCAGYTWYIAVDFQLYIVLALALFVYDVKLSSIFKNIKSEKLRDTPVLTLLILLGGFILPLIVSSLLMQKVLNGTILDAIKYLNIIYIRPYTRCATYFLGSFLALFILKVGKVKLSRPVVILAWMICISGGMAIVLAKFNDIRMGQLRWSRPVKTLYEVMHRPVFGIMICWVIWACHYDYGGLINKFLSLSYFVPMGRISYGMYLCHWSIIFYKNHTERHYRFFTAYNEIYIFLTTVTLTIFMAFVAALTFEMPFTILEKLIFPAQVAVPAKSNSSPIKKDIEFANVVKSMKPSKNYAMENIVKKEPISAISLKYINLDIGKTNLGYEKE